MRKLLLLLLLTGCKNDAVTSANLTIPVDTTTVIQVDTIPSDDVDTVFVTDTLIRVDTVLTQLVYDSVVFPLEGYIGDATMETLDLGRFQVPTRAQVWVQIELSANSQKDEAWGLVQILQNQSRDIPVLDCPIVPDHPWLGSDWILVGFAEPGDFSLEARHASLYDCYDPVDYFRTANSVHFKQIKFVFHVDIEP